MTEDEMLGWHHLLSDQSFLKILGSFLSLTRGSRNSKLHVADARLRAESGDVCGKDERVSVAGGCCRGPNKMGEPAEGKARSRNGVCGTGQQSEDLSGVAQSWIRLT